MTTPTTTNAPNKKVYVKKSVEIKIMDAATKRQFVKIYLNDGKFNYDDKVQLTSKTFTNKSTFVLLYSCRMIGTMVDLNGFMQQDSLSDELRELMMMDMKQTINVDNFESNDSIDVYNFGMRADKGFMMSRVRTAPRSVLIKAELSTIKDLKSKADKSKADRCISLDDLPAAVYMLTECFSTIQQYPVQKKTKEGVVAPPKKNLLIARVEDSLVKSHYLDVSQCSEVGGGTHKTDKPPTNACFFRGFPGLKNVYFVPTRDTNPRSPTHGVTNVGALNFTTYYFEHVVGHGPKSYAQCKELVSSSFAKAKEDRAIAASTPKAHAQPTVSLDSLGLENM
jgi:hypothetical protein